MRVPPVRFGPAGLNARVAHVGEAVSVDCRFVLALALVTLGFAALLALILANGR